MIRCANTQVLQSILSYDNIFTYTISLDNLKLLLKRHIDMFKSNLRVYIRPHHPPFLSGIYLYYQLINYIFLKVLKGMTGKYIVNEEQVDAVILARSMWTCRPTFNNINPGSIPGISINMKG